MLSKDKPSISVKGDLINLNHGKRFPLYKNFGAIGIVIAIIIVMLLPSDSNANIIIVPLCLLILLIILTSTVGLKINLVKKVFQIYFGIFGLSFGKWKKYSNYTCLVLKTSQKKRDRFLTHHDIEVNSGSEVFITSELYLMDSSHRRKIFCGSFDSYEEAKIFAKEVSEKMNYPIEKFSPKRMGRKR